MGNKRASDLLERYFANTCTQEEREFVQRHYNSLINPNQENLTEQELTSSYNEGWEEMKQEINPGGRNRRIKLFTYGSAAAILIVLAIGYFLLDRKVPAAKPAFTKILQDVAPGGNNAILTLSNGQRIDLNKASTGKISTSLLYNIHKIDVGEVVFTSSTNSKSATISTPKGGQFKIQLPDGSKVWLNAASSLTFPGDFKNMAQRSVELSGEGYFEIARNTEQPFIVKTGTQEVKVLGTHFNVNSYPDEKAVITTLLEGSVRIFSTKLSQSETLKPGQMALHQNNRIMIQTADENAVAWKEGKLKFKETDLASVLRQVARWYDLTIRYEGKIPDRNFSGGIDKTTNLSTLLKILELSQISFTITEDQNGKTLIVKDKQ